MNSITNESQIRNVIDNFHEPILFTNLINNWPILRWTLNDWKQKFGNRTLQFRKNKFTRTNTPLWERTCETTHITMEEFLKFNSDEKEQDSWLYFDYKYMKDLFQANDSILKDICWRNFGFPEMSGRDSTLWIGTNGAHTPCHVDTYGCNLIAQIYGRKQWIIFPPEENLKPTRVPYEESSIYSKINFFTPNLNDFKGINKGRSIILNPGEVLFLPAHWWHYVENLETAISVNIWLPQSDDNRKRIEESIVQLLIAQLTKDMDEHQQKLILNPNSNETSEIPLSVSLNLLEQVTEVYKNDHTSKRSKLDSNKSDSEESMGFNLKQILEGNPNMKIIPEMCPEEFTQFIREKESKYPSDTIEKKTEPNLVEKLINSICNPEIINAITEKLLKQ